MAEDRDIVVEVEGVFILDLISLSDLYMYVKENWEDLLYFFVNGVKNPLNLTKT